MLVPLTQSRNFFSMDMNWIVGTLIGQICEPENAERRYLFTHFLLGRSFTNHLNFQNILMQLHEFGFSRFLDNAGVIIFVTCCNSFIRHVCV